MTQHQRFNRDGEPVTGQPPVQVWVVGGVLSGRERAAVNAAINKFVDEVRLGGLSQLRKTAYLDNGVRVQLNHVFGSTSAVVYPKAGRTTEEEVTEPFVGGIVVELSSYADGVKTTLPESQSSGKAPGLPGRPAVPGTAETDETTHVIIQIKKGVNLAENPILNEHVKIWRIKDPLLGACAEVPYTDNKYLVSAKVDTTGFPEFYIQGRRLTGVPALVVPSGEGFTGQTSARLGVLGYSPEEFAADPLGGVLFLAAGRRLYGFDSGNPGAGWQLLDEASWSAPLKYINSYGDLMQISAGAGGSTTLTCSGSNGAGVCSGFSASLNPAGTLSGTASPMHDGSVEAVMGSFTYTVQGPIDGAFIPTTIEGTPANSAANSYELVREYVSTEGATEKIADRVFGGFLPSVTALSYSETLYEPLHGVFNAWVIDEGGITASGTTTSTFSYSQTRGAITFLSMTFEWSRTTGVSTAYTAPSLLATGETSYVQTLLPPRAVVDRHTGKLVLRRGESCSQDVDITYPSGTFDEGLRTLPPGEISYSRGALSISREVVRHTGEVLAATPDVLGRYSPALGWAGPAATTSPETLFYVSSGGGAFKVPTRTLYEQAHDTLVDNASQEFVSPIYDEFNTSVAWASGGAAADVILALVPGDAVAGPPPGTYTHNDIYYGPGSPQELSANDYVALFPPTQLNPTGVTQTFISPATEGEALFTDSYKYFELPQPPGGSFNHGGEVLYDIRTSGFLVTGNSVSIDSLGNTQREFQAWVGNDVSIVPFADVIEEWRALGQQSGVSSSEVRFNGVDDVSLI